MAAPAIPVVELADTVTATIAASGSVSPSVNMGGRKLIGFMMPAAWTSADITFQGSFDNSTFYDMYDTTGAEIDYQVAASRFIVVNSALWLAPRFVKVRSGTTGTPVVQAAQRIVTLIVGAPT